MNTGPLRSAGGRSGPRKAAKDDGQARRLRERLVNECLDSIVEGDVGMARAMIRASAEVAPGADRDVAELRRLLRPLGKAPCAPDLTSRILAETQHRRPFLSCSTRHQISAWRVALAASLLGLITGGYLISELGNPSADDRLAVTSRPSTLAAVSPTVSLAPDLLIPHDSQRSKPDVYLSFANEASLESPFRRTHDVFVAQSVGIPSIMESISARPDHPALAGRSPTADARASANVTELAAASRGQASLLLGSRTPNATILLGSGDVGSAFAHSRRSPEGSTLLGGFRGLDDAALTPDFLRGTGTHQNLMQPWIKLRPPVRSRPW